MYFRVSGECLKAVHVNEEVFRRTVCYGGIYGNILDFLFYMLSAAAALTYCGCKTLF